MKKFRMHFKDFKLRNKFLISFVLVIFLSLSMSSLLNYYTSFQSIETITSSSSNLLLDQVALNFERSIREIEEFTFLEYKNAGFCGRMEHLESQSQFDQHLTSQAIFQFLYRMVYSYDEFPFAMMYSTNGQSYTQIRQDQENKRLFLEYELNDEKKKRLLNKRGQTIWSHGNEDIIFVKRAMYDPESYAYCGVLILGVEADHFKSTYPHSSSSGEIMFSNQMGELLIYNDSQSANIFKAFTQSNSNEFYYNNNQYIHTENWTSDGRWKLLNIISFDRFTSHLRDIQFWVLVSFVIAFVIAFINAALLSNYITKRLNVLVNSMKNLSVGALDTFIRTDTRDEIGIIAEKFNLMAANTRELVQRVGHERLQKERAEYRQLEFEYKAMLAQLNPHFLYNTLESIHSLAKIEGQKKIGRMIYLLGKLMRESISRKQNFIELREEIIFIKDYLTLQNIMYESRLQVEYEIEDRSLGWIVPRFILQPILENAIVHGIEEKTGIGVIRIRCYEEGRDLVMEVKDNGVGMSQKTIASLLSKDGEESYDPSSKHTGVGVRSVQKRLQILFGQDYGITIHSELNLGTTIVIKQPKTKKGDLVHHESSSHR